jgi:hypothetical protein
MLKVLWIKALSLSMATASFTLEHFVGVAEACRNKDRREFRES